MHRLPPPPLPPVDMAAVPPLDGGQVVVPLGRLLHGRDDPVVEAGEQDNWDHTWESFGWSKVSQFQNLYFF